MRPIPKISSLVPCALLLSGLFFIGLTSVRAGASTPVQVLVNYSVGQRITDATLDAFDGLSDVDKGIALGDLIASIEGIALSLTPISYNAEPAGSQTHSDVDAMLADGSSPTRAWARGSRLQRVHRIVAGEKVCTEVFLLEYNGSALGSSTIVAGTTVAADFIVSIEVHHE